MFALPFVLAAFLSLPGGDEYVVLSGVGEEDPYYAVAERIAKLHRTETILRFDPESPEKTLPELTERSPTYVALVVRPEQITVDTVRRFLTMATRLDEDVFVDFSFGYLTGATAEEALEFAENIAKASRKKGKAPRQVGEAMVIGSGGKCSVHNATYQTGALSFPSRRLYFTAPDGSHGRDQEFVDAELANLEGCGAILMGGHGMPWEINTGPRAEDVAKLELFPAVAFNYACHTGATLSYPETKYVGGNYTKQLLEVESERSFALSMIRAGVTGYVAYVNPRPAGPELSTDFGRVLSGATLGEARRNDYAKIVLGYLGFGETGIIAPDIEDVSIRQNEVDSVRHLMLEEATGGILYGDPAFQPYPSAPKGLPISTSTKKRGKELHVTMRMEASSVNVWCADPFRWFDKSKREMAMKLYDRVELPKKFGTTRSVRYKSAKWAGQPLETLDPVWAIEVDQNRRYLHLKAGFKRDRRSGVLEIEFVVSTKEDPR